MENAEVTQPKYLRVGALGLLLILVISGAIIFSSPPNLFMGWLGFIFICATPVLVLLAMVWGGLQPAAIGKMAQPFKGMSLTAIAAALGFGIAFLISLLMADGQGPNPILTQFAIFCVVMSLWVMPVWECWPFSALSKNIVTFGIIGLIFTFVVSFAIWAGVFNYDEMQEAPFYAHSFAPSGPVPLWPALIFSVTTAGVIVATLLFDFWPIEKLSRGASQPLKGCVATIFILLVSALTYWVFTGFFGMDPVAYLVQGPVSIMYGVFVALNIFQFQLFAKLKQPIRGLVLLAITIPTAIIMYQLYKFGAGIYADIYMGGEMPSGPSGQWFEELWIATAMLGVTFPIIVILSGFFEFWPLQKNNSIQP